MTRLSVFVLIIGLSAQLVAQEKPDAVFPVAGATGFGSLEATAELKAAGDDVRIVGVDVDWYDAVGDPERVILTSVLKNTGAAVYNTTAELANGTHGRSP